MKRVIRMRYNIRTAPHQHQQLLAATLWAALQGWLVNCHGQKWKTGTGRQYLQYLRTIFNHCDVFGQFLAHPVYIRGEW